MILVMDVGNNRTVLGLFVSKKLIAEWRLATDKNRTVDEYGIVIKAFLNSKSIDYSKIEAVVLSSVVPPLTSTFAEMSRTYFGVDPLVVGPGIRTGLSLVYENPKEVGADRVVNAVAA
ncbi:MAG TPA: pantothenate kinase, partial [Firmicutes bacterium]|nr:pantothenate kinase [Bacillota bacterium]